MKGLQIKGRGIDRFFPVVARVVNAFNDDTSPDGRLVRRKRNCQIKGSCLSRNSYYPTLTII
jgi:hypothetical protein